MHGLPHDVVATQGERHVADAARNLHPGQFLLDAARRLDEIHRVVVVFLDPRGDRQHVGIEDDIFRRKTDSLREQVICAVTDPQLVGDLDRLPRLVKRHHHHRRSVPTNQPGTPQELLFTVLEADGVHDRFALYALEPRFQHGPPGAVDHHRHTVDVRFGGDQVQEPRHHGFAIQQRVVHVHVDNAGPRHHLFPRDFHGRLEFLVANQPGKTPRAGHIGALPHHHKIGVGTERQRFLAAESCESFHCGDTTGRHASHGLRDLFDVRRCRAATSSHNVQPPRIGELTQRVRHVLWRQIEAAELVRQAGVGMTADVDRSNLRQFGHIGAHLLRTQGTVDPHADQRKMGDRVPECLDRLTRKRAAGPVGDRDGGHHGHFDPVLLAIPVDGKQAGLQVQRVKGRLRKQDVDTPFDQRCYLLVVRFHMLIKCDRSISGVLDAGRHRGGFRGGPDRAGHEARPLRVPGREFVRGPAGTGRRRQVDLPHQLARQGELLHPQRARSKRVRLDDVCPRRQVLTVDLRHGVGAGQAQHIHKILQILVVAGKPRPTHGRLIDAHGEHGRPHGPVEYQDALGKKMFQLSAN